MPRSGSAIVFAGIWAKRGDEFLKSMTGAGTRLSVAYFLNSTGMFGRQGRGRAVAHILQADYHDTGIAHFGCVRGVLDACADIAVDKFEDDNSPTGLTLNYSIGPEAGLRKLNGYPYRLFYFLLIAPI